ncbi:MAG: type III polyketide synthase [Cyclobacteriaceae bacterium]
MPAFISSIGTAVPKNRIKQSQIAEFMLRHLKLDEAQKKSLQLLYRASGIQYRHSVLSDYLKPTEQFSFYPKEENLEPFPQVGSRMALYKKEAILLCKEAVLDCVSKEELQSITHLITVSCTGMYAPGIDIELIEQLDLPTNTQRTAINFMGCYAAFNALKVADHILHSDSKNKVLIVAVELCSIHMQKTTDEDTLLSNALFGDGAAAVFVEDKPSRSPALEMAAFYADLDTSGKEAMAWQINDFGFEMKLSQEVPYVIQKGIKRLTEKLLSQLDLRIDQIDHFAIHPGGKRILQVIEEALEIQKDRNVEAYNILRNFGNMSSPTVLFVLKNIMQGLDKNNSGQNLLSFAFGPGLTLESMLLKIH